MVEAVVSTEMSVALPAELSLLAQFCDGRSLGLGLTGNRQHQQEQRYNGLDHCQKEQERLASLEQNQKSGSFWFLSVLSLLLIFGRADATRTFGRIPRSIVSKFVLGNLP